MRVIDIIKQADKTLFSFELLPPLRGNNISSIYKVIDPLMDFNPAFINVTYHQEEVVYKKHPSGLLEKKTIRKRPGTVAISAAIKNKYTSVEVVPHLICGGFSKEETEYALIDFHYLGIDNILALRGDAPKNMRSFQPEGNGHVNADQLVSQINEMNHGKFLDDEMQHTFKTNFCIGVAGYPEKHIEAPNMATDLNYLKQKIDAGAEFIITQMFFDNAKYFSFVDACRKEGISVPIIPGLKPICTMRELNASGVDLNLIPSLLALLRRRNVTRAADDVGLSQPAMSRALGRLREVLDDLPEYYHLLIVTRGRGRQVFRSRVVIRKRGTVGGDERG